MTLSILNNTNKSNYRKYEYGELLIFMNIFLYKTVYGRYFSLGTSRLFLDHLKAQKTAKKEIQKFFRFILPAGEVCLVLPKAGCADAS